LQSLAKQGRNYAYFSGVETGDETRGKKNKGMSTFPQLTDFTARAYGNLAKLSSAAILIKYKYGRTMLLGLRPLAKVQEIKSESLSTATV